MSSCITAVSTVALLITLLTKSSDPTIEHHTVGTSSSKFWKYFPSCESPGPNPLSQECFEALGLRGTGHRGTCHGLRPGAECPPARWDWVLRFGGLGFRAFWECSVSSSLVSCEDLKTKARAEKRF